MKNLFVGRLAALLVLITWSASHAESVRVAILTTQAAQASADAGVYVGARAAVQRMSTLEAIDAISVFDPGSGPDQIATELDAAQAAFNELNLPTAIATGERVLALATVLRQSKAIARASLLLVQTRLAVGDKSGALRSARLWHRLQSPPLFEARRAPPSVQTIMRKANAPAPLKGAVRISANVPGRVWLNGEPVGITPLLRDGLPVGPTLVNIEAVGFRRWSGVVDLSAESGVAVQATLLPAVRQKLLTELHTRLPDELQRTVAGQGLRDLRALFFAEQAVLLETRADSVIASLFDLGVARRVRSVKVYFEGDGVDAGREAIERLYDQLDPRAPGLAAPKEPEPVDEGPPYWKRWWFWSAVAGATIAAVAVPLLLSEDEDPGLERVDDAGAVIIRF